MVSLSKHESELWHKLENEIKGCAEILEERCCKDLKALEKIAEKVKTKGYDSLTDKERALRQNYWAVGILMPGIDSNNNRLHSGLEFYDSENNIKELKKSTKKLEIPGRINIFKDWERLYTGEEYNVNNYGIPAKIEVIGQGEEYKDYLKNSITSANYLKTLLKRFYRFR